MSFKFLSTALIGSLVMALVATFSPLPGQIAVLGAAVSILAGLLVAFLEQNERNETRRNELLEKLEVPVSLAPEHDLFDQYKTFAEALSRLARKGDPVLREFAAVKLASIAKDMEALSHGTLMFASTETWRTVYEDLLLSEGIDEYRSVAWVKTADYWQDAPGKRSMRANYEFLERGGRIQRLVILGDGLWAKEKGRAREPIHSWLMEQHGYGVDLYLIHERDVSDEADILCDFGIYGSRAVGVQELDGRSRTTRFVLSFDSQTLCLYRDRIERVKLYATSFGDLLDRASPKA